MNTQSEILDVALIGGGIMSTTLGAILGKVLPDRSIALFERLDVLAGESSSAWNNAGTGHAGLCELNYMPDADDGSTAFEIADRFAVSRRFWSALTAGGDLDQSFVNPCPHMNVVFGESDCTYLRRRWETLRTDPRFAEMEYSEDPDVIHRWAPLVMDGRSFAQRVAATRHVSGTDVDFGSLTTSLADTMRADGCLVRTGYEVTKVRRGADGLWAVSGRILGTGRTFRVRSRFVFVGAGGYALRLLQKSGLPEIRGYGVFPFGAEFLRTDDPAVVARHQAKVYGKPALGAPPMSLPHLDRRIVDGDASLMFGPYATFSTRLLKEGRLLDLFTTMTLCNLPVLISVGLKNIDLVRYLLGQLVATRRSKFAELVTLYPKADPAGWYSIRAGQRAQVIAPTGKFSGELRFGTEIISGADGSIAGLLGASPGASVAPSVMVELLDRCFSAERQNWEPRLARMMGGDDVDNFVHESNR